MGNNIQEQRIQDKHELKHNSHQKFRKKKGIQGYLLRNVPRETRATGDVLALPLLLLFPFVRRILSYEWKLFGDRRWYAWGEKWVKQSSLLEGEIALDIYGTVAMPPPSQ